MPLPALRAWCGGIGTTLRAKRGRKRGGARNGAERAALYTKVFYFMPQGETRRRNIPEREKGLGAGKRRAWHAPTAGRTRTAGAGRYAAPTRTAHRSGERREEMKKPCEARREARRESIPLSRRGGGKPRNAGKPRGGVGGGGGRSMRAPRRNKAHPRPKGRGKRRRALRAPAFRGHRGGGAPSGERGASAPNTRRM